MRLRFLQRVVMWSLIIGAAGPASAAGAVEGRLGPNLLLNPGAQAGAASAQGWDGVTIPGWRITEGLPTVVRFGTEGFPGAAGRGDQQMFAGGAGGTARLTQRVPLRTPAGRPLGPGVSFSFSARLGGTRTSAAAVIVDWFAASGRVLGHSSLGPVGEHDARAGGLKNVEADGVVPAGATDAGVTVVLATTDTNVDGPNAPVVGYDRATAGDLRLSVTAAIRRPAPLRPPAARVPRFDHVFLFYFENEDFGSVIGNRRQAPYLNSLVPQGSVLGQMYAEEHPSDGNYLALAAGSVFGVPLDDPLEENPLYTIRARNIGDLIDAAHETWKAYLQSADGPCDDTVHGYYWDDDLPFLYFADIRDRPAYCAAHLLPLQSLSGDLSSASTTPNFVWVSPDDCSDMEGCGIQAGDRFLADELRAILTSPSWRTQRSLAIITFDEDGYDHEHPPQRVPTLILGSAAVRRGFTSKVRYTHYSLLRTIEAALGLGTLTVNDRYAGPTNDVFDAHSSALQRPHHVVRAGRVRDLAADARAPGLTAFVANSASASVTPIVLATRRAGKPIRVGRDPEAIATTPGGRLALVVDRGSDSVTPIDTTTRTAGRPIRVGSQPQAIAITPDGRTAYVVNSGSDSVTPINIATLTAGASIPVGADPRSVVLTPDGSKAYVADWGGGSVTPIDVATNTALAPIRTGSFPVALTVAAGGARVYVADYGSDAVTPIDTASDAAAAPIPVGQAPDAIAATPDGGTVEVVDGDSQEITPIASSDDQAGRATVVGYSPTAIAIGASGRTAYVVNTISGTVSPVDIASGTAGHPISIGAYAYPTAITLSTTGTALVVDTYAGQVSLVDTRTHHASRPITVGSQPVAAAIGA
jgi:YVTN family beta-propeller protein